MPIPSSPRHLRIGLAGLGNVGAGVYKNLQKNASLIQQRTGASLTVGKVVVRNLAKARDVDVPAELLTTEQYAARGFLAEMTHPTEGRLRLPQLPVQWNGRSCAPRPAPRLPAAEGAV